MGVRKRYRGLISALLAASVSAVWGQGAGPYDVIDLGTLGGPISSAHGINASGQVTGLSRTSGGETHAFVWSESGGMIDLGTLGGSASEGWGINDAGEVVGESLTSSNRTHAFHWNGSTMVDIHPGGSGSGAWAINNENDVVGWNDNIFGSTAFRRRADGTYFGGPGGSELYDINNPDGEIGAHATGFWTDPFLGFASVAVYDVDTNTALATGNGGSARGINQAGTIVGYNGNALFYSLPSDNYATQVFVPRVSGYSGGRFYEINDHGVMVGSNTSATLPNIGVLYSGSGSMINVNTLLDPVTGSGWNINTLRDINNTGWMVGTGEKNGEQHAIALVPTDADGDGLNYAEEVFIYGTNPNVADTDGDGLKDGDEVSLGINPLLRDSDNDGIPDGTEVDADTDPLDNMDFPSDVYVDGASGSDETGFGTKAHPWATVAHAVDLVQGKTTNTIAIHVAEGTYTVLNAAGGPLLLDSHEHLFGGYESAGWTRDVTAHSTTLDASVAVNGNPGRNAVILNGIVNVALDGFTVTGVLGTGDTAPNGAGILGMNLDATTTINDCVISDNIMDFSGSGGILLIDASPTISGCSIVGNRTELNGGGICISGQSAPVIDRCTIASNRGFGAGIVVGLQASALITNSVISGNHAGSWGGGAILSGGSGVIVVNCTIANNNGDWNSGGGIEFGSGSMFLINCIFAGNRNFAIADYNDGAGLLIENCLFDNNPDGDYIRPYTMTIRNGADAINAFLPGASNNISGAALFATTESTWTAPATYDAASQRSTLTDSAASFTPGALKGKLISFNTSNIFPVLVLDNDETSVVLKGDFTQRDRTGNPYWIMDHHLQAGSAAIDMGRDTSAPVDGGITTDFDGVARGFDGDGLGAATADGSDYDIGAYESEAVTVVDALTVLSPNGGEMVSRGTYLNITWDSAGNVGSHVRIAARKGNFNATLATAAPNNGLFEWFVPANYPLGNTFYIEISSVETPDIADTSDGFFTIQSGPAIGGTVTVLSPNGGDYLLRGDTVPISWNSTGYIGGAVKIFLRRGASGFTVASSTPNDGSFDWTIPAYPVDSNYTIEISAVLAPAIIDSSDTPFTITNVPPPAGSITVTAPNGGESYLQGDTIPITWLSSGAAGTDVAIIAHGGGQNTTVAASTANDGAFDWSIPQNQTPGTNYTIEVRSLSAPGIGDSSNAAFTIAMPPPAGTITVLTPNGGESYLRGDTLPVSWVSTGNPGSTVQILAHGTGQNFIVVTSTENDGAHDWTIPPDQATGTNYVIEVRSLADPAIGDSSDAAFTIAAPISEAGLTLTSPNGGEVVARGAYVFITWTSTGDVGSTVKLAARKGNFNATIATAAPNDGYYEWLVPASFPLSSDFYIEITSNDTPTIQDTSDATFTTEASPPVAGTLTLLSPNGGETIPRGATVPITWNSTGYIGGAVRIYLYRGGTRYTITSATPNDGSFAWTVPSYPLAANYTIEISAVIAPAIVDTSDGTFSLTN